MVNALDARGLYTYIPGGDASVSNVNRSMSPQQTATRSLFERAEQMAYGDVMGELADGTGGIVFQNNNLLISRKDSSERPSRPSSSICTGVFAARI